jgi:NTE family protein
MMAARKKRLGLALGSGSARGWAHVGVLRALEQAGIHPDLVCGTSVGSLVGAAYAAGELDRFEQWLLELRLSDVVGFMDVSLSGGMLKGARVMEFFRRNFVDRPIRELRMPFAAVGTALQTGQEVWMREGSTVEAVRASIALPGLFTPVWRDAVMLVDGGLVNPVPVSLARALGAEIVIAVDLASDKVGRHLGRNQDPTAQAQGSEGLMGQWKHKLQEKLGALAPERLRGERKMPSMHDVLFASLDIMQVQIGRNRMASDPPDLVVAPHLAHLHLLDFHRAGEAIAEGKRAVAAVAGQLDALLDSRV